MIPFVQERILTLGVPVRRLIGMDTLVLMAVVAGHVVVPWWIAEEEGASALAIYGALMAIVSLVGMPLLAPLGDRLDPRRLIVTALLAFAVAASALAAVASFLGYSMVWLLVLQCVPVLAIATVAPASHSLLARLVASDRLTQAVALQQTGQSFGRLLGPVIGGTLLALCGVASALWVQAALIGLAALLAARLPRDLAPAPRVGKSAWGADLLAGLKANGSIPVERGWMLFSFVSFLFLFPALTLLLPLKVQSLGLDARWLGACEAALAVGLLAGAMGVVERVMGRLGRYSTIVGAAAVQGLSLAAAGQTSTPLVLVGAFVVVGLGSSALYIVGSTQRTLARPRAFRARMFAGSVVATQLAAALGPTLAGAALSRWPVADVYLAFGLVAAALAVPLAWMPGFREFMSLTPAEAEGWHERRYPHVFASLHATPIGTDTALPGLPEAATADGARSAPPR